MGKGGRFESEVRAIVPAVNGLEAKVIDGDQFLQITNGSGKTVVVKGYDNEPYLRFLPDKTVDRNAVAPATYLNADRQGLTPIPKSAKPKAPPEWRRIASDGRYRWFDHRIHITTKGTPKELRNVTEKKKVFNWTVPMLVNGEPVRATGTLFFDPASDSGGGFPVWAGIVIGLAVLVLLALAATMRRRRRPAPAGTPPAARPSREKDDEAW